jgi:hypothetical protein
MRDYIKAWQASFHPVPHHAIVGWKGRDRWRLAHREDLAAYVSETEATIYGSIICYYFPKERRDSS